MRPRSSTDLPSLSVSRSLASDPDLAQIRPLSLSSAWHRRKDWKERWLPDPYKLQSQLVALAQAGNELSQDAIKNSGGVQIQPASPASSQWFSSKSQKKITNCRDRYPSLSDADADSVTAESDADVGAQVLTVMRDKNSAKKALRKLTWQ